MLRQLVHTHPNAEVASPAHANLAPKMEEGSVSSGGGRKEGESVLKSGDDDYFDV